MRNIVSIRTLSALAVALAIAMPATGATDEFWGTLAPAPLGMSGGGTGWGEGAWVPDSSGWWTQWFYNDPPYETNWKEVYWDIDLSPEGMDNNDVGDEVEVAINWSLPGYVDEYYGDPPIDDEWIGREIIWSGVLTEPVHIVRAQWQGDDPLIIGPPNPEWVSIDIRYIDEVSTAGVYMAGFIYHDCVPEPCTLSMMVLCGLVVLRRKCHRAGDV